MVLLPCSVARDAVLRLSLDRLVCSSSRGCKPASAGRALVGDGAGMECVACASVARRITNSLMMHGRNNGKKLMAVGSHADGHACMLSRNFKVSRGVKQPTTVCTERGRHVDVRTYVRPCVGSAH